MNGTARKRPMSSSSFDGGSSSKPDDSKADCPFTIRLDEPAPHTPRGPHAKRRKGNNGTAEPRSGILQKSTFDPKGKFRTYPNMDVTYFVEPRKKWSEMTRYNTFVLNGNKYHNESFVYVANELSVDRQQHGVREGEPSLQREDAWVARVLEIRALDEHHVYARVCWMYWPDELPKDTWDGKKLVSGRQPYHGQSELIASNHMDVINVVSVLAPANVNQWIESDDDDVQQGLYWRQAFDTRKFELSTIELICVCKRPANPDKTLIGCPNPSCGKWLHSECLHDDVLTNVYKELGTDKPHVSVNGEVKREMDEEQASVNGSLKEVKGSISVQGGETANHEPIRELSQLTPSKTETPPPNRSSIVAAETGKTSTGRGRKKKNALADRKPYEGLFEATLKMADGLTTWKVRDRRENVKGGDKEWVEKAKCLHCNTQIE